MSREDTLQLGIESSDFPADRLRVRRIAGKEAVSTLYDFEVDVVRVDRDEHDDGAEAEAMTGASVTLTIERLEGPGGGWSGARKIHGLIAEVDDLLETDGDLRAYRLRVVPHAFALTMVETQDIYMGLSVPDVIRQKLQAVQPDGGFELRLAGKYGPREFLVQYKESDYALVCRLAEHLGISFYFAHGDEGARMIFTDHAGGFTPVPGAETLQFRGRPEGREVFALTTKRRILPAFYAVRDYNYRTPQVDLTGERELSAAFGGGIIEFGSHHKTPEEAKALATVRAEEAEARQLVYAGKSAVPALAAGMRVKIDHPELGALDLLITEVTHEATASVASHGTTEQHVYTNSFRAIPADRTFRPARVTPKPRIAGLVTGIVDGGPSGPDARYAFLDEQGRYLVRFLFDTAPAGARAASRPVRMIQNHAGASYGTHFPLKPGVEVVLGFIDGDPDRPLIVGAVPNPTKPSPVTGASPGLHRVKTSTGITVDMAE